MKSVEEGVGNIATREIQDAEWSELFTKALTKEEAKRCLVTSGVLKAGMEKCLSDACNGRKRLEKDILFEFHG